MADQNFEKALEAIELALSANPSARLNIWRAHALMFLDRADEAKDLYTRYRDEKVDGQSGTSFILGDFTTLRRWELDHPLMNEIETLFTARTISR